MHPVKPAIRNSAPPSHPLLAYFVAGSLLLHALLVVLWQGKAPAGPSAHSTFQVTLLARHGDAANERRSAEQTVPARTSNLATDTTESVPAAATVTVKQSQQSATAAQTRPANRLHTATGLSGNTKGPLISSSYRRMPVSSTLKPLDSEIRRNDGKRINQHFPNTKRDIVKEAPSRTQRKQLGARSGSTSHGRHELTSAARYRKTRRALLEALLPHFDYPPLARRRGWQGRVNVGLHVAADGDLTRIRLVKSSGYTLLDRAALRNVAELRGIPRAAQWLEGNGMDLVLPVRYQLAD